MITSVDTNILLDILIPNSQYALVSKESLDDATGNGSIIICEVVYAELSSQFQSQNVLDLFLSETGIKVAPAARKALYMAGTAWKEYAKTRGKKLQCPECGDNIGFPYCKKCGREIPVRQHIISDFIIGAHALDHADRLLTRDRGYYKTYFKDLVLSVPNI